MPALPRRSRAHSRVGSPLSPHGGARPGFRNNQLSCVAAFKIQMWLLHQIHLVKTQGGPESSRGKPTGAFLSLYIYMYTGSACCGHAAAWFYTRGAHGRSGAAVLKPHVSTASLRVRSRSCSAAERGCGSSAARGPERCASAGRGGPGRQARCRSRRFAAELPLFL